jgi:hypothetical protein
MVDAQKLTGSSTLATRNVPELHTWPRHQDYELGALPYRRRATQREIERLPHLVDEEGFMKPDPEQAELNVRNRQQNEQLRRVELL